MLITRTFDVEFRRDGTLHNEAQATQVLAGLADLTGLIVISHGWNNDVAEATALYAGFAASLEAVAGAETLDGLGAERLGLLRVFWPSKKFADADLIPGGGAASAADEGDMALARLLDELAEDPLRLGDDLALPERIVHVRRAIDLSPLLDESPEARREFVQCLRALLNADDAHAEDGSSEFFSEDPEVLFDALSSPVIAPPDDWAGGATTVDGGATGFLGDLMNGAKAAARRLANFATYHQMKSRAGLVGTRGLSPLLASVRGQRPGLPLHLVGHSFGARLVTAAASQLPVASERVTLTLLQAAFSHNALASRFDGTNDGSFRSVLADQRVSGPVLVTHTKNDRAVGIAYPLASRISRDVASALGDENDPYGGLGRNGALFTPEADNGILEEVGHAYEFAPNRVFNLRADQFIADHGDVTGREVAYAFLCVVLTRQPKVTIDKG